MKKLNLIVGFLIFGTTLFSTSSFACDESAARDLAILAAVQRQVVDIKAGVSLERSEIRAENEWEFVFFIQVNAIPHATPNSWLIRVDKDTCSVIGVDPGDGIYYPGRGGISGR